MVGTWIACFEVVTMDAKSFSYYVHEIIMYRRRACTWVLFLSKAELGFFHFLEIVTSWLLPSSTEDPPC